MAKNTEPKKPRKPWRERPVKAYEDTEFLSSREARPLRILAEYYEPELRFERFGIKDTIVFFGSARCVPREIAEKGLAVAREVGTGIEAAENALTMSRYYEDARTLARRLTEWSKDLAHDGGGRRFVLCSGGGPGIMEAANRGASEAKGLNIGLNISLPFEQFENPYITRHLAFNFHYFFMRKYWFAYLAKAIVIFPGGFGTIDELFEIATLIQTGKVRKPLKLVLYGASYWREVINFDALVKYGTVQPEDLKLITMSDDVDHAYDVIVKHLSGEAMEDPEPGPKL
jgi:uncharacterized protein (TIGR00730 family)